MKWRPMEISLMFFCIIGSVGLGYWMMNRANNPPIATVFYHFDYLK